MKLYRAAQSNQDRRRLELWTEAAKQEFKHRLDKPDAADDAWTVGTGTGAVTIRRVLEHQLALHRITSRQYDAGYKYRIHWHRGGLDDGNIRSVDLDRIPSWDCDWAAGMLPTEDQVFHRQQIRAANTVVGELGRKVIEAIVIADRRMEWVGLKQLGWTNRPQATAAALERLRVSLDALCQYWSI